MAKISSACLSSTHDLLMILLYGLTGKNGKLLKYLHSETQFHKYYFKCHIYLFLSITCFSYNDSISSMVSPLVNFQIYLLCKRHLTQLAFEWLYSCVKFLVCIQITSLSKCLTAFVTFESVLVMIS